MPAEFLKEGTLFMNRCTKPDKKEFIRISQAVGIGFLIMGTSRNSSNITTTLPCH